MLRCIKVVAAIIRNPEGRYLITQRTPTSTMPLLWEFPGGRVEDSETDEQALARELREEMGIIVRVGERAMSVQHSYPHYEIDFRVYHAEIIGGEIEHRRVHDHKWVKVEEMERYEFPGADARSMDMLLTGEDA